MNNHKRSNQFELVGVAPKNRTNITKKQPPPKLISCGRYRNRKVRIKASISQIQQSKRMFFPSMKLSTFNSVSDNQLSSTVAVTSSLNF